MNEASRGTQVPLPVGVPPTWLGAAEWERTGRDDVLWGAWIDVPYGLEDRAYELVAKKFWHQLQETLSQGWRLIGDMDVEEEHNFMMNCSTIRVRARLRRVLT